MRTTPTEAMEVLSCVPPLDLFAENAVLKAVLRLQSWDLQDVIEASRGHRALFVRMSLRRKISPLIIISTDG